MLNKLKNIYHDIKYLMGNRIYCVIDLGEIFEYEKFHTEIIEWSKQNIKGKIVFNHTCQWWWENAALEHWANSNNRLEIVSNKLTVGFSRPNEAMLFKLRWGNI